MGSTIFNLFTKKPLRYLKTKDWYDVFSKYTF